MHIEGLFLLQPIIKSKYIERLCWSVEELKGNIKTKSSHHPKAVTALFHLRIINYELWTVSYIVIILL